ncbi:hypothetical protein O4328_41620 [Rhodococcus opacus]|uniref:Uncharacterized protein n=1 Tax=Rhodococcus opacus TaxID=37919 RepID=A0AAX3Y959_RHOOP|nr:hypothetical protein [Rhodococcus opacus]MCZ4590059.1 hypothetical protein [Rhodococcus opacus]WLF44574.1 hypothetical protein Q5707_21735 [Rhodococcus opacus]
MVDAVSIPSRGYEIVNVTTPPGSGRGLMKYVAPDSDWLLYPRPAVQPGCRAVVILRCLGRGACLVGDDLAARENHSQVDAAYVLGLDPVADVYPFSQEGGVHRGFSGDELERHTRRVATDVRQFEPDVEAGVHGERDRIGGLEERLLIILRRLPEVGTSWR